MSRAQLAAPDRPGRWGFLSLANGTDPCPLSPLPARAASNDSRGGKAFSRAPVYFIGDYQHRTNMGHENGLIAHDYL
jgi:hypothetical protein